MTLKATNCNQDPSHMSQPSNGITPEVIRESMLPYELSPDLLQATLAAIPKPPPDATRAWRHAHIARLTQEISALMPANAAQARIAAQILIYRELADTRPRRPTRPPRISRCCAASPAPRPRWCRSRRRWTDPSPGASRIPPPSSAQRYPTRSTSPHWTQPGTAPPTTNPSRPRMRRPRQCGVRLIHPTRQPTPPSAVLTPTEPQPQPDRPPCPPANPEQPAATTEWTITKLDEGPGWSREVLRHRSSEEAENSSTP
jgi:hypothetical protein